MRIFTQFISINLIFYIVIADEEVEFSSVANEQAEPLDRSEEKRKLGRRSGGFGGGFGMMPAMSGFSAMPSMGAFSAPTMGKEPAATGFLLEPVQAFSLGGGGLAGRLGNLKMAGAEASVLRANAHNLRKGGGATFGAGGGGMPAFFAQPAVFAQPSVFAQPEAELMAAESRVPEMAAAPFAGTFQPSPIVIPIAFSAPAAAPAPQIEPIVIETVVEPRAERESSIGKELLLQRISDRLDERLDRVNVAAAAVPVVAPPAVQLAAAAPAIQLAAASPAMQLNAASPLQFAASPAMQLNAASPLQFAASPAMQLNAAPALQFAAAPAMQLNAAPAVQLAATPAVQLAAPAAVELAAPQTYTFSTGKYVPSTTAQFTTGKVV